jgi:DNA-binding SARP family transcriptional activator
MGVTMLNVTLLGGASFSVDGAVIKSDLGPAGRLLACYLFEFMGRPHRRERLADLFWGEMEPDKSRSAMNTAVWRIRKMLDLGGGGNGRRLVTIGEDVLLEPSNSVQVDTEALQALSKRALGKPQGTNLTVADEGEIGRAIDSYGGPFLDGDDGDWVLQERERLHGIFVRSTLELMRCAARRGEHERALEYGQKIIETDPLRESVQRDVMLLLVLSGQQAKALVAYQKLRSVLKADLGIEPMPDTKRLHQEIESRAIFDRLDGYVSLHFGSARAQA